MRTKLRIVVLIIVAVLLLREYVFKPSDPIAPNEPTASGAESAPFGEARRGASIGAASGSGLQPSGETASCIVDRIVDGGYDKLRAGGAHPTDWNGYAGTSSSPIWPSSDGSPNRHGADRL